MWELHATLQTPAGPLLSIVDSETGELVDVVAWIPSMPGNAFGCMACPDINAVCEHTRQASLLWSMRAGEAETWPAGGAASRGGTAPTATPIGNVTPTSRNTASSTRRSVKRTAPPQAPFRKVKSKVKQAGHGVWHVPKNMTRAERVEFEAMLTSQADLPEWLTNEES